METTDTTLAAGDGLRVLGGYPGANAADVTVDGDTVRLRPDLRDAGGEWLFYWSVGVESDRARELTVSFPREVVGPPGPAVSHDRREWTWLGADRTRDRSTFEYAIGAGERVYFAFAPPYVRADFDRFWTGLDAPRGDRERLTTSEGGRSVPVCRLGDPEAADHVVVAARHHACESPGSYVVEGVLRAMAGVDSADRCVHALPLVDVDGVQRGDQGKTRVPHDHNRDYAARNGLTGDIDPLYRSTAAIQAYVRDLDGVTLSLDLHAPFKWGDYHDEPFLAGDPTAATGPQRRLAALLADEVGGDSLPFDADPGFAEPGGRVCGASFDEFLGRQGAAGITLEAPYFGTDEARSTPASLRALGRALGRATDRWLA